jgi:ABC-type transport system involved in multi-copper enzyme maturation permease subunit
MKYSLIVLIIKELKYIFKSKTSIIYFILLFALISYSFFSAVDLYSKASVTAIGNALYASGFEPIPGVFAPTFGGFFLILSLIAPFLFIRTISDEKNNNTIVLIAQFPHSLGFVFCTKILSAITLVLVSIISFIPLFFFWHFLGGYLPWEEILLLISGYIFYSLFVISVSFFSASFFKTSSQASIFSIALIMFSWFIDFGKEMYILSFFDTLSQWTVTARLKQFEDGILSMQSIFYFFLIAGFLFTIAYFYFNFSIKHRGKQIIITTIVYLIISSLILNFQYKLDISESQKNSFSTGKNEFLKVLPDIDIKVFLEPTDSRFKDYERDFLKKLKMVKSNQDVHFASGKSLHKNYGRFEYTINNKTVQTFSNSEYEIFMVLEKISGIKIKKSKDNKQFKGYPLTVKKGWSIYLFILYLFFLPLITLLLYFKKRRK